jgi:hypothetical protein
MLQTIISQFQNFRKSLYDLLPQRADSTMDLVDALSSNTNADSVVKLSLNPLFRRRYCSVFDVVENFLSPKPAESTDETRANEAKAVAQQKEKNARQALMKLIGEQCPSPTPERPFRLFGLDCTSGPRPYATKLEDRHVVYSPNPAPGNKPIVVGHQYSTLAYLPERETPNAPAWVLPCSTERVPSQEKGNEWGMKQLSQYLQHPGLDWDKDLSVVVGDSLYNTLNCQKIAKPHENLVLISRLRGNRNVYAPPAPSMLDTKSAGHPTWYGEKMNLKDIDTHLPVDVHQIFTTTTRKGKPVTVTIDVWYDMRTRGSRDFRTDQYPFTLLRIRVTTADGRSLYKHPLWLAAFGPQRRELTPQMIYECFRQRYDLEHYFRFGKQRLLMDSFQTPTVRHEENWWQLTQLAYVQLYLARDLATPIPHPWERYLPEQREPSISSPSQTLRSFPKIIGSVGTPAVSPTPRGQSPGRLLGNLQPHRPNAPVIYKSTKQDKGNSSKNAEEKKTPGLEIEIPSLKTKSYPEIVTELQAMVKEIGMSMREFLERTTIELAT